MYFLQLRHGDFVCNVVHLAKKTLSTVMKSILMRGFQLNYKSAQRQYSLSTTAEVPIFSIKGKIAVHILDSKIDIFCYFFHGPIE